MAEVHAHTRASDGMVDAEELIRAAAAIGLRVVCVTDHDTIPDLGGAVETGAALGVDVVRGEEVTASFPPGIHIVGLFVERQVRMHMSVEDTVDAIHDQGGLAIVAHPFMPTWFASMTSRRARQLLETHTVDGIEIRHTAPVLPGAWKMMDEFYAEHRERIGAAVGAGDSHFGAHDLGRVVTYKNSAGEPWSSPVGDILRHVATHGCYHRGQIATHLRLAGLPARTTDYIYAARQGLLED